jgi:ribosomal protein S13
MLSSWVGTSEGPAYAKQVASAAGLDVNSKISDLTKSQLDALQVSKIKKESP